MSISRLEITPSISNGLSVTATTSVGKYNLGLREGCSEKGTFVVVRDRVVRFYRWGMRTKGVQALFAECGLAHNELVGIEALLCANKEWGCGRLRFVAYMAGPPTHRWSEYSRTKGYIRAECHYIIHTSVNRATERITVTLGDWAARPPWQARISKQQSYSANFRKEIEAVMRNEFKYPVIFNEN
ncbi:hypothetical protein AH06_35 [Erwinia phage AH06]|nr:hypothetical protein AH06_35 [Erwinia phage AH06]